MGRSYAGVLGLVAFAAAVARGVVHDAGIEATLGRASASLAAFMAIGWVIGRLAEWIVEESDKARLNAEAPSKDSTVVKAASA